MTSLALCKAYTIVSGISASLYRLCKLTAGWLRSLAYLAPQAHFACPDAATWRRCLDAVCIYHSAAAKRRNRSAASAPFSAAGALLGGRPAAHSGVDYSRWEHLDDDDGPPSDDSPFNFSGLPFPRVPDLPGFQSDPALLAEIQGQDRVTEPPAYMQNGADSDSDDDDDMPALDQSQSDDDDDDERCWCKKCTEEALSTGKKQSKHHSVGPGSHTASANGSKHASSSASAAPGQPDEQGNKAYHHPLHKPSQSKSEAAQQRKGLAGGWFKPRPITRDSDAESDDEPPPLVDTSDDSDAPPSRKRGTSSKQPSKDADAAKGKQAAAGSTSGQATSSSQAASQPKGNKPKGVSSLGTKAAPAEKKGTKAVPAKPKPDEDDCDDLPALVYSDGDEDAPSTLTGFAQQKKDQGAAPAASKGDAAPPPPAKGATTKPSSSAPAAASSKAASAAAAKPSQAKGAPAKQPSAVVPASDSDDDGPPGLLAQSDSDEEGLATASGGIVVSTKDLGINPNKFHPDLTSPRQKAAAAGKDKALPGGIQPGFLKSKSKADTAQEGAAQPEAVKADTSRTGAKQGDAVKLMSGAQPAAGSSAAPGAPSEEQGPKSYPHPLRGPSSSKEAPSAEPDKPPPDLETDDDDSDFDDDDEDDEDAYSYGDDDEWSDDETRGYAQQPVDWSRGPKPRVSNAEKERLQALRERRAQEKKDRELQQQEELARARERQAEAARRAKEMEEAEIRETAARIAREQAKNERKRQKKERQKQKKQAGKNVFTASPVPSTSAPQPDSSDNEPEPVAVVLPSTSKSRPARAAAESSSTAQPSTSAAAAESLAEPDSNHDDDAVLPPADSKGKQRAGSLAAAEEQAAANKLSKKAKRAAAKAELAAEAARAKLPAAAPEGPPAPAPAPAEAAPLTAAPGPSAGEASMRPRRSSSSHDGADDDDLAEFARTFNMLRKGESGQKATASQQAAGTSAAARPSPTGQQRTLPVRSGSPGVQARSPSPRGGSPQPPPPSAPPPQARPQPATRPLPQLRPGAGIRPPMQPPPSAARVSSMPAEMRELEEATAGDNSTRLASAIRNATNWLASNGPQPHLRDTIADMRIKLRDGHLRHRELAHSATQPPPSGQPMRGPSQSFQPPPAGSLRPQIGMQHNPRPPGPPAGLSPPRGPPQGMPGPPRPPYGMHAPPGAPIPMAPHLLFPQPRPMQAQPPPRPVPRPPHAQTPYQPPPPLRGTAQTPLITHRAPIPLSIPPRPLSVPTGLQKSPPRPVQAHAAPAPAMPAGVGGLDDDPDSQECVVCLDNEREMLFVPCGHLITCSGCAAKVMKKQPALCPLCRTDIMNALRPAR